jgi:hypothetical protein
MSRAHRAVYRDWPLPYIGIGATMEGKAARCGNTRQPYQIDWKESDRGQ